MLDNKSPIIVGISGASGSIYGITLLKHLKQLGEKTILVASNNSFETAKIELDMNKDEIISLADTYYENNNLSAPISSGSYLTKAMIIAPCSIKSLSSIANSYNNNLLTRSADVILKERRKLILLLRETPLHLGHISLMKQATESGAIIMPPVPAFYNKPKTIEEIVENTIFRVVDLLEIPNPNIKRWSN